MHILYYFSVYGVITIKSKVLSTSCVYLLNFFVSFCLEFQKIALATAVGFAIMGFIGFFVKLIHIPINNIIV